MDADDVYARIREEKGPTKRCAACDTEHPVEDFTVKSSVRLQLHPRCRDRQRAANRASYRNDPAKQRNAAAARRARVREEYNAKIDRWLEGRACTRCGEVKAHMLAIHREGEKPAAVRQTRFHRRRSARPARRRDRRVPIVPPAGPHVAALKLRDSMRARKPTVRAFMRLARCNAFGYLGQELTRRSDRFRSGLERASRRARPACAERG